MAARSCTRATGRYYDWTKYELARGSFGGDIWCIKYRAIDNPNDPVQRELRQCAWPRPLAGRRRLPRSPRAELRRHRSDDFKPMSQDSYSAGFDFEVNPRTVATVHYVHNNLNRTIEDLGALVDGNEAYFIGNPGEGTATITPTSFSPADAGVRDAEAEAAVRRGGAWHQPPVCEPVVRKRQPDDQPAVRQLRRPRELGRNPHPDDRRVLCDCTAAGRFDVPSGRQRKPRLGLRRTTVRLTRHA